jgi:ribosomal-protein-alanine N-acetyltransferase
MTTMSMGELETVRLRLRKFSLDDLDDLCLIFSKARVVEHIGDGQPASREQSEFALESMIRHYSVHGFGRLAVIEKVTGKLIGYGGLRSLGGTPELVYLLDEAYWNRGLATELGCEVLRHGFEEWGFDKIVAMTKPANWASRRVLEKLEMNYEGQANYYDCDVAFYSLTRESFTLKQPQTCS